jgi:UDP-N-acetylmuramoylalanine--D-glutamate ligase
MFFSSERKLEGGVYLQDDRILYNENGKDIAICDIGELKIIGKHNYENVMASVCIALCMNVPVEVIRSALKEFDGIEHRIEFVAEKNGIIYYNDSKGTNPDASQKAIEAMTRPTILIAGGYDKKADFDQWAKSFNGKVKTLVLIGETKNDIRKSVEKTGFKNIFMADTFEEAFEISLNNAKNGDAVLLSPACASWGMFRNYEERGNIFKQYVKEI